MVVSGGGRASAIDRHKQKKTIFVACRSTAEKGQLRDFLLRRGAVAHCHFPRPRPRQSQRSGATPGSLILARLGFTQSNALASCQQIIFFTIHFSGQSQRGVIMINNALNQPRRGNRCHPLCCLSLQLHLCCCHGGVTPYLMSRIFITPEVSSLGFPISFLNIANC